MRRITSTLLAATVLAVGACASSSGRAAPDTTATSGNNGAQVSTTARPTTTAPPTTTAADLPWPEGVSADACTTVTELHQDPRTASGEITFQEMLDELDMAKEQALADGDDVLAGLIIAHWGVIRWIPGDVEQVQEGAADLGAYCSGNYTPPSISADSGDAPDESWAPGVSAAACNALSDLLLGPDGPPTDQELFDALPDVIGHAFDDGDAEMVALVINMAQHVQSGDAAQVEQRAETIGRYCATGESGLLSDESP